TSADGTATKTYTVTVTRAAAPTSGGGGGGGGGATTTTSSGGTSSGGGAPTTTAATTTTSQPTQAATVVNQPRTVAATPGTAGTVAVVVASAGPATSPLATPPVSVAVSWAPDAFTQPVSVQVTPKPQVVGQGATAPAAVPVAGGFSVGSTVVQVTVTTGSGQAVTEFAAPLVVHVSAITSGEVPAYSHDGSSWTTIPRLSSPALPAGQA